MLCGLVRRPRRFGFGGIVGLGPARFTGCEAWGNFTSSRFGLLSWTSLPMPTQAEMDSRISLLFAWRWTSIIRRSNGLGDNCIWWSSGTCPMIFHHEEHEGLEVFLKSRPLW